MNAYTPPSITVAGSVRTSTHQGAPGAPLEVGSLPFPPDPVVTT